VLNLSLPNVCVESFGLTILEGMSYGCPCIVPVEGGHHDYFDQGCGLAVDARETSRAAEFIQQLASDLPRWRAQADRALATVQSYSAVSYVERVNDYLQQLDNRYFHSHLSGDQG
jgi:glycosyltransferase involved in cell wall biosynthesis